MVFPVFESGENSSVCDSVDTIEVTVILIRKNMKRKEKNILEKKERVNYLAS
jgi:hypothetical protein